MISVNKELKEKYDSHYSDSTEEWRRTGAVGKVENIRELASGLEFKNVVDIGAGDGNILSILSDSNFCEEYTAVEISDSAIKQMKAKNIKGLVEIKQFDGYNLPFADKQFDLAICSHVIEHVEHPRQLLSEIKRISKAQIFEVPIDFSFKVDRKFKHYNAYGHINIYTPALFNFLLYTLEFKIVKSKCALYKKEIAFFNLKIFSLKFAAVFLKRVLWKSLPFLMKIKPNTYTVLTR